MSVALAHSDVPDNLGLSVVTDGLSSAEDSVRTTSSPTSSNQERLATHRAYRSAREQAASPTDTVGAQDRNATDNHMLRTQPATLAREEKLQEWEGRVISILEDRFIARLTDVTLGAAYEEEEGEFPLEEISDADRELVRQNAIFRWVIGYRSIGATKERFGRIVFRRLPAWSRAELNEAKRKANKLAEELVWE